ncbi:MAG: cobalamin biosynthesis protein P47K [Nitrososphaerales archaeon]|nr:cobalamin biosynthesis protein P47K [Nitrososphaerales archaeon]
MQFLIISGFFGSGKTTLILELARELVVKRGKKIGIIVNDIGEVGIDDKVMKSYGLNVKEMFGGCICCEMAVNLPTTLKTLRDAYNPDIVILEPSGIADASNVNKVLKSIENLEIDVLPVVSLFDATQFDLLIESLPFIIAQVKSADIVLINKIDTVLDPYYMKRLEEEIHKVNKGANVIHISALHKLNIDKLIKNLLG